MVGSRHFDSDLQPDCKIRESTTKPLAQLTEVCALLSDALFVFVLALSHFVLRHVWHVSIWHSWLINVETSHSQSPQHDRISSYFIRSKSFPPPPTPLFPFPVLLIRYFQCTCYVATRCSKQSIVRDIRWSWLNGLHSRYLCQPWNPTDPKLGLTFGSVELRQQNEVMARLQKPGYNSAAAQTIMPTSGRRFWPFWAVM